MGNMHWVYDKSAHEARKYWRGRLESMSFEGHVPLDHPRPDDGRREGATHDLTIEPGACATLHRLTGSHPVLLYASLLLVLEVCCYKYSGRSRVTVFSPVGPGGPATADFLPIGATLDKEKPFHAALVETKELLSEAFCHQDYPWSRILLDLSEDRRPGQLPLMASMVGLVDPRPDAPCDIAVRFDVSGERATATFRYDRRLFEGATIAHLSEAFHAVLAQGLRAMSTPIAELNPHLGGISNGRRDVGGPPLAVPDAAHLDGDPAACLHELILDQWRSRPDSTAVVQGRRITTCGMLDCFSSQLMGVLHGLPLDAIKPVVILMDAGTEMIVAMVAALRAGLPFSPVKVLSAKHPLSSILAALECECLICRREHVRDLATFEGGLANVSYVITVGSPASDRSDGASSLEVEVHQYSAGATLHAADDIMAARRMRVESPNGEREGAGALQERRPSSQPVERSGQVRWPDRADTACVLLDGRGDRLATSAVTHADLAGVFGWLNAQCGIRPEDRCLLSPGLGSAEQLYDTLGMLLVGASVEILDVSSSSDKSLLVAQLLEPRITVWDVPGPLMENLLPVLLARIEAVGPRGPRVILLGGEKQSVALVDRLTRCFPDARIVGLHADPSVGIWTTAFLREDTPPGSDDAAVALPIPVFEHQVLNESGECPPLGAKGELYLRRVDSAAAPDRSPWVKTGLRAVRLTGGGLSWLRGDGHSVLRSGCRVELTRLEAILSRHDRIHGSEVLVVPSGRGREAIVVAFLVADPGEVSADAVRDFLAARDDVDVVPDRIVLLDDFPLSPDGSIDHEVLIGRIARLHASGDGGRDGPADEVYTKLRAMWLDILQLDDMEDGDSFFVRGGNSLKATLLIARISAEFSVDLSVQAFFRDPSLRAVARLIESEAKDAGGPVKGPEFRVVPRGDYRLSR